MTCIVAIAQNGVVYMGSDHAASDDKTGWILSRKEPKCCEEKDVEDMLVAIRETCENWRNGDE